MALPISQDSAEDLRPCCIDHSGHTLGTRRGKVFNWTVDGVLTLQGVFRFKMIETSGFSFQGSNRSRDFSTHFLVVKTFFRNKPPRKSLEGFETTHPYLMITYGSHKIIPILMPFLPIPSPPGIPSEAPRGDEIAQNWGATELQFRSMIRKYDGSFQGVTYVTCSLYGIFTNISLINEPVL